MFEFISEFTEDDLQNIYSKPAYDSLANRQTTVSAVMRAIDKRLDSIRCIINNPDTTTLSAYELETLQAEYSALCELHNHYVCNSCDFVCGNYYSDCLYVEEPLEELEEPVEEPEPVFEYTICNIAACTVENLSFTDDLACIQYLKHDRGFSLRHIFDDLVIKRPFPFGSSAPLVMRASVITDCWFDDVPPEVE